MAHKTHYSSSKEAQKERIEGGIRRLREGQERKEGAREERWSEGDRTAGEERGGRRGERGWKEKRERRKEVRRGERDGREEGRECPCQETYHPSGSPHELVLPTKGVSTGFIQQQRTERVPAPAKLVHVLP